MLYESHPPTTPLPTSSPLTHFPIHMHTIYIYIYNNKAAVIHLT